MFGSKQGKNERLMEEVRLIEQYGELSPTELSEKLGVPRKTIYSDLVELEKRGIFLQEDNGKLSLSEYSS